MLLSEAGFGEFSGVLPPAVLDRLAKLDIDGVAFDDRGRLLRFVGRRSDAAGVSCTTRLLTDHQFPSVDAVLEHDPPKKATLPVAPVRAAMARLASVSESTPLRVRIESRAITVSVDTPELGGGVEHVDLPGQASTPFSLAVNRSYLAEALDADGRDGAAVLACNEPNDPLFLSSTDPAARHGPADVRRPALTRGPLGNTAPPPDNKG